MLTSSAGKGAQMPAASSRTVPPPASSAAHGSAGYVLPLLHTRVPSAAVEVGFWGGLAAAAVLGAVDPALVLLVGAGVVIARHRRG